MKKIASQLIFGKNTTLNGLIALAVIATIALGCNCSKDFNLNADSSSNSSGNSGSKDNPFGTSNQSNSSTTRADETKPDATKGALPTDGELQYLVRDTMLSFNQAIQNADFNDFYSGVSKMWKKQTSAEAMKSAFQSFIDGNASFGAISSLTADISSKKTRKEAGYNILEVQGQYDTSPIPTTFDLSYVAEGSEWKLFKIEVHTGVKR